jgi:hypothetical protein
MKEEIIAQIVDLEWRMFSTVANVGGRALCQYDPITFEIMRRSQASTWPDELLESWFADLSVAWQGGRNLMSEKYAWMMETTFPDEYQAFADRLPFIEEETLAMIEEIVATHVDWKLEVAEHFPRSTARGGPFTPGTTTCATRRLKPISGVN